MSEGRSKGTERKLIFILKEVLIRHTMVKFMCLGYRMCFRSTNASEVKSLLCHTVT